MNICITKIEASGQNITSVPSKKTVSVFDTNSIVCWKLMKRNVPYAFVLFPLYQTHTKLLLQTMTSA